MSNLEILKLQPERIWKHFHDLTQIPRPTHHVKEVCEHMKAFGKSLGLETVEDEVGNVLIRKPASKGKEGKPTVILQSHVDIVPQKNSHIEHDFTKDPIKTVVEGDILRACDTTLGADNGVGVAMIMAYLEDNTMEHPAIEALFTVDEEEGMDGAFGLKHGFLKGSLLINLDTEEEGDICVGCAGGADGNVLFQFKDDTEIPEGDVAFKISLTGLNGGHSGCDIHVGLGNANKMMNRFLKVLVRDYEARLSSINGGSLRNAIPRESFAVVTIPEQLSSDLIDLVKEYEDLFIQEFTPVEKTISFKAEKVDLPTTLIPEEIQDSLINAVEGCPNGVMSMLSDFPGVVESSLNLALVKSEPGQIDIKLLIRSSSESRKEWVCSAVESVFTMAGAKVEFGGVYPGWQPNINSKLLSISEKIYLEKFGKRPNVNVIHAGLECGIISSSTDGLDIVSFGPTIKGAHSPDEHVIIPTVGMSYDFMVEILKQL